MLAGDGHTGMNLDGWFVDVSSPSPLLHSLNRPDCRCVSVIVGR